VVDIWGGKRAIEFLSIDTGPGMVDVHACLADGYSTGGTAGTGIGAARRLSDEFDIFSTLADGTVILCRVGARNSALSFAPGKPSYLFAAVALNAPGEIVCGDAWSLLLDGSRAALFVADGLGHGSYAAEASNAALAVFERLGFEGPSTVLTKVHDGLRSTRGAAVAMAAIDRSDDSILFSGAGNISGRLISGIEDRTLMSQHGTAGMQIPHLKDMPYEWPAHSILVMHSDGLTTRWSLDATPEILSRHPALIAGWLVRSHCRGPDDCTVVVLKRKTHS
jgi:hypothetical protein